MLSACGKLAPRAARDVSAQLLHALVFLHEDCGIIHTDIKPENVLLVDRGLTARGAAAGGDQSAGGGLAVRLTDFGNAIVIARQHAPAIQTRQYRCPESIIGARPFAATADVWSLGCLA